MTYETALKLKRVGFSQEKFGGTYYDSGSVVVRNGERLETEECYAPSLGELVSYCDRGWLKLEHHGENGWVALKGTPDGLRGEGKTADEALANLFEAMNKN